MLGSALTNWDFCFRLVGSQEPDRQAYRQGITLHGLRRTGRTQWYDVLTDTTKLA